MRSQTVASFGKGYADLAPGVQRRAHKTYRQWRANPFAPGLRFKRVSESEPIYSVRIGRAHRALGLLEGDTVYWYFMGSHDEYDRVLRGKILREETSEYVTPRARIVTSGE